MDDLLAVAEAVIGRAPEVHDWGLLESALARPQASVFGEDAYPTVHAKAAALFHSLACNHGLKDGNKRTAVAAVAWFYHLNGHRLTGTDDAVFDLVQDVATHRVSEVSDIAERLAGLVS